MNSVLNISEAASIAIHSLALIAATPGRINVNKLAELTNFSRNHIAKIMQLLTKRSYLTSGRGPKGGYILKKNPRDISLLEIYELIDGTLNTSHCSVHDEGCPFNECVFGNLRERLGEDMRKYLAERTIYDILKTKA
jgi:Rrf2 family protein